MKIFKILALAFFLPAAALSAAAAQDYAAKKFDLEGSSFPLKMAAINFLKADSSSTARALLVDRLEKETDIYIKTQLIEAVNVNWSTGALAAVLPFLDDANPAVQQSAVISLSRYGPFDRLLPRLEKTLASSSTKAGVRNTIVNAFSLRPTTSSVAALDRAAGDEKHPEGTRHLAIIGLDKAGTKDARDRAVKHSGDKSPAIRDEVKKISKKKISK
ncbi:MAG: hypothetical protein A3J79_13635 [Elusimicrobia bacterium RIFOXYB2_FULL_62_6]|nr:MAG: hypothetical protein A3J79_13635 [Elusimicrobia bacterium RIFOXYB2_FULL_62_6]